MVSGDLLLAMKYKEYHRVSCPRRLLYLLLYPALLLLIAALLLLLTVSLFPMPGLAQDTSALVLWSLGEKDGLATEFDLCPGREEIHYVIFDQSPAEVSDFPGGLAAASTAQAECLPSKISLHFSTAENYARLTLSIAFNGQGECLIHGDDSIPLSKIRIDAPFGLQKEKITWPYLASGEHSLVLEATGVDSYLYFDYLTLSGFKDTDQDGISDREEGDGDRDGDEYADWQDGDCTTIFIPLSFPYEGNMLLTISIQESGQTPHSLFTEDVTFYGIQALADPNYHLLEAPAGQVFTYGMISCGLKNLRVGGPVMFSMILPRTLHGLERVWAEDYEHQWRPLDVSYQLADNQIDFSLSEGDAADKDGVANGQLTLLFGFTIPVRLSSYDRETCFIGALSRRGNLIMSE